METEKTNTGSEFVLGYEPYFNQKIRVAAIHHKEKEIVPCHGYCAPHPMAKKVKKYAKKIGYQFRNW